MDHFHSKYQHVERNLQKPQSSTEQKTGGQTCQHQGLTADVYTTGKQLTRLKTASKKDCVSDDNKSQNRWTASYIDQYAESVAGPYVSSPIY